MSTYTTEIDVLNKYKDLFPDTFLKCIKEGCTWLAAHNNITYQTTTMVRTDSRIYTNSGSTALRVGIIDTEKPLSGLQFYDILAIGETVDNITGNTVFKVKAAYKTPLGIEFILIPIKYFSPTEVVNYYNRDEIDTKLETINELIKNLENKQPTVDNTNVKEEVLEEVTNTLADYVTLTTFKALQVDMNNKADIDITNELRTDVGVLQTKTANYDDLATKVAVEDAKTELSQQLANNLKNTLTRKAHAAGFFFNGGDQLTKDNKLYFVKTAFMATDNFENDKANLVEVLNNLASIANKADKTELATYATQEFVAQEIAKVNTGGNVDLSEYAKTTEVDTKLADYTTTTDLTTNYATKTELTDLGKETKDAINKVQVAAGDTNAIVQALKADDAFKASVKGETGPKGDSVSVTDVKDELVTTLKADPEFLAATKGEKGDLGADLTEYIKTADADGKYLDQTTYTTDKADFATKTELAAKADTTALADYLTTADAEATYLKSADASTTYLTKDDAANTYQTK